MHYKEIGSDYWDTPLLSKENNNLLPKNTLFFISGRSALEFILTDIMITNHIKVVALPSWCCDSIILPFCKYNIKVIFYSVHCDNKNLIIDYSASKDADITLILSYFGYNSYYTYGKPNGIIIRDVTHSLFSSNFYDADYFFGSLRKWDGFITGGFMWSRSKINSIFINPVDLNYVQMRKHAMKQKKNYINGISKEKKYLNEFTDCENRLASFDLVKGYDEDIKFANTIDISYLKKRRIENAKYLLNHLSEIALFKKIDEKDCPLFFPILLNKDIRDSIRNTLKINNIYCPIHWPLTQYHNIQNVDKIIYNMELSIICDQRYTIDDMNKIINCINF